MCSCGRRLSRMRASCWFGRVCSGAAGAFWRRALLTEKPVDGQQGMQRPCQGWRGRRELEETLGDVWREMLVRMETGEGRWGVASSFCSSCGGGDRRAAVAADPKCKRAMLVERDREATKTGRVDGDGVFLVVMGWSCDDCKAAVCLEREWWKATEQRQVYFTPRAPATLPSASLPHTSRPAALRAWQATPARCLDH